MTFGLLVCWHSNSLSQITVDQYGWQSLTGGDLLGTPGIQRVCVNPVDDSTVVLTDNGQLLVFGAATAAGELAVVSTALISSTAVVSLSVQSLFWTGTVAAGNVFAFQNGAAPFELNANAVNVLTVKATAVFFVARTPTVYDCAIISYSDQSVYVAGAMFGVSTAFFTKLASSSTIGLPVGTVTKFDGATRACFCLFGWGGWWSFRVSFEHRTNLCIQFSNLPLRSTGYYNPGADGRIYALTSTNQIYVLVLAANIANPKFILIEYVRTCLNVAVFVVSGWCCNC